MFLELGNKIVYWVFYKYSFKMGGTSSCLGVKK